MNNNAYVMKTTSKTEKAAIFKQNAATAFFILSLFISFILFSFSYYFIDVKVWGVSMQPTVNISWSSEENYKQDTAYIYLHSTYKKGDIVVVKVDEIYVIKRVIAMAGDKINMLKNNLTGEIEVFVNNKKLEENYIVYDKDRIETTSFANFNLLRVTHWELFDEDGNLVVPQDKLFYMGDNRANSQDCAYYGPQETNKVIGKVNFIVPYGQTFFEAVWSELF